MAATLAPLAPQSNPYRAVGQANVLAAAREREVVVVGPADTGKSRACLEKLHAVAVKYPGCRLLMARETRKSLTQSAMVTYEKKVLPVGSGVRFHTQNQEYRYPNGSVIVVGGLDDPEKLFSTEFDAIYVQEITQITLDDWENLTRSLRNGVVPYQQIAGDLNPTHELFWAHVRCDEGRAREIRFTHADNPSVTPERLATLAAMTGIRRERLYLGNRVSDVEGSYYGQLLYEAKREGRVGNVPHDPAALVHTAWDLGIGDYTAIWFFQVVGQEWRLIDYYENSGEGLAHYVGVLQRKAQERPLLWGRHYLPHDAAARELGTGKSRQEVLGALGLKVEVGKPHRLEDQHEGVRNILPRAWFDAERCRVGIQWLISYRKDKDEKLDVFRDRPVHDRASHGASALATGVMGYRPVMTNDWNAPATVRPAAYARIR